MSGAEQETKGGVRMDQIRIEDLEVYCHHGVTEEEKVLGQKFLVSLKMYMDVCSAGQRDDLALSVDYAEVAHFVETRMKERDYKLIEAVAEHMAEDVLMAFPQIERLEIQLKKPWAPILLPLDTVSIVMERGWTTAYLSLGSNMGDREENLTRAINLLREDAKIKDLILSDRIETKPYGYTDQPDFLNMAVGLRTLYSPAQLLGRLQEIERAGKRERTVRWGPRTIDLDILFYGEEIIQTADLTIPHRDMHRRMFVLEPLAQIAPWAWHPRFRCTVSELREKARRDND